MSRMPKGSGTSVAAASTTTSSVAAESATVASAAAHSLTGGHAVAKRRHQIGKTVEIHVEEVAKWPVCV